MKDVSRETVVTLGKIEGAEALFYAYCHKCESMFIGALHYEFCPVCGRKIKEKKLV